MLYLVLMGFVMKQLYLVNLFLLRTRENSGLCDHHLALGQDLLNLREIVLFNRLKYLIQFSSEVDDWLNGTLYSILKVPR